MKLNTIRPGQLYKLPLRITLVIGILIVSVGAIYIMLTTTNPSTVGPVGITGLFILVFVATITTFTLVKMIMLRNSKVTIEGLVGISLIPALLLALGSLRQLGLFDVLLIVLFVGLVNFYVRRATKKPDTN